MAGGEKRAGRLAAEPLLAPVIVSHTTPDDVPAGGVYTFVRSPREAACSTTTATSACNRPASPRAARAAAHDDPANLLTQDNGQADRRGPRDRLTVGALLIRRVPTGLAAA